MARPDIKNGYAAVPNELIRQGLSKVTLSSYEWRIFWAVVGLSWSWQRPGGYATFRELAHLSGLPVGNVHRAVKSLIEKFILITRTGFKKTWFEVNMDYMTWRVDNLDRAEILFSPEITKPVLSTDNAPSPQSLEPVGVPASPNKSSLKQSLKQEKGPCEEVKNNTPEIPVGDFDALFKMLAAKFPSSRRSTS